MLLCSGCMPVVQHGPWVRRGASGAIGGTAGVAAEYGDGSGVQPFFSFEGGMRAGITPNDSSHRGAAIGLQLPVIALFADAFETGDDQLFGFIRFLNADAYITGPTYGATRTSAGVTASSYHLMPYIQAGELDDWYGTLGVILLRESDAVIIAPSFTQVRRNNPTTVSHVTYTAGLGVGGDDVAVILGLSLIFEFHRKNARP
jgi:hypothetical protein